VTRYRISRAAQSDIIDILAWTQDQFGEQARRRYEKLIATGIRDISSAPARPGSIACPELGDGVRTWHLRGSRSRTGSGVVRRPRHFLIYRVDGEIVVIGRLVHDAMELRRHVDTDRSWE
jgi:toxin ParE1/3/4